MQLKKEYIRFITMDSHILNNESSDCTEAFDDALASEEFETSSNTGFDTEDEGEESDNSYSDDIIYHRWL